MILNYCVHCNVHFFEPASKIRPQAIIIYSNHICFYVYVGGTSNLSPLALLASADDLESFGTNVEKSRFVDIFVDILALRDIKYCNQI